MVDRKINSGIDLNTHPGEVLDHVFKGDMSEERLEVIGQSVIGAVEIIAADGNTNAFIDEEAAGAGGEGNVIEQIALDGGGVIAILCREDRSDLRRGLR